MSALNVPTKGGSSNFFLSEHLATFVIGNGTSMTVEEGLKRLQQIEKSGGVWTLKVRMQVVPPYLIVLEENSDSVIEKFALKNLKDVQSVNASGAYNNLIVFTVMDSQIPELHVFRCIGRSAGDFVSSIEEIKTGRISPGLRSNISRNSPIPLSEFPYSNIDSKTDIKSLLRKSLRFPTIPAPENVSQISDPIDRNVKLLDCLFSDIETFVNQLQRAIEAFNNLKKRRTLRENGSGDGLLSMRCKLPPGRDFTDILQKFKLSFILIEKLKQKITNPNAPELIHFLYKPLLFVVKVIAGPNFEKMDLVRNVDNPLITEEVRYMFENCLDSAENDLWRRLGRSWTDTSDEWHEKLPTYRPVFQDGWSPPLEWMREIFPDDGCAGHTCHTHTGRSINRNNAPSPRVGGYRSQEEFMTELKNKNAKIAIVKEQRSAANQKELTVNAGDVLEVLDDTKNWWKVRNYRDETGFVTRKILQLA